MTSYSLEEGLVGAAEVWLMPPLGHFTALTAAACLASHKSGREYANPLVNNGRGEVAISAAAATCPMRFFLVTACF